MILAQPSSKQRFKVINTFKPHEWQVAPWLDTSPVMLLTGSAGGGKSRLAAEKLHAYCLKYPGATALILRKERATLSNSTILMLERKVIGTDPRVSHHRGNFRFEYDNGSILCYGGMKDDGQRERIRSIGQDGSIDIAWMEEATQFVAEDFNELLARMRGKAAPWCQIVLTTNPDGPNHWINIRLILGNQASVYRSSASDNPSNPEQYSEWLNMLTGVEYRRLVLGEWVAGTGLIIDTWLDDYNQARGKAGIGNVTEEAEYLEGNSVFWAVDDGYSGEFDERTGLFSAKSHPRVFLFCQVKHGLMCIFAEHLAVQELAVNHISRVLEYSESQGWPLPSYAIRDRAAASLDGALWEEYQIKSYFNHVPLDESIKELRQWVGEDRNKVRRLLVHPRCFHVRHEMLNYSMDEDGKIIKQNDHTIDAARYMIWDLAFGRSPSVTVAPLEG